MSSSPPLVSFARGPRESLERAAAGLLNELPRERTPEQREEQGAAARQAAPQRRIGEQQLPQDTDARLQQAVEALGRDDNKARSPLNCGGGGGGWGLWGGKHKDATASSQGRVHLLLHIHLERDTVLRQ